MLSLIFACAAIALNVYTIRMIRRTQVADRRLRAMQSATIYNALYVLTGRIDTSDPDVADVLGALGFLAAFLDAEANGRLRDFLRDHEARLNHDRN